MRIAFDLDETLLPVADCFLTEPPTSRILRWLVRERLRAGGARLLADLAANGHEVWVYTTSLRSPAYLRLLFAAYGVSLKGIVNASDHEAALRGRSWTGHAPSKYPPAFEIDLLVDNSAGVQSEALTHGFNAVLVSPGDSEWHERVRAAVRRIGRPGAQGEGTA